MTTRAGIEDLEKDWRLRFPSTFAALHLSGDIVRLENREVKEGSRKRFIERVLLIPAVDISAEGRTWYHIDVVATQLEFRLVMTMDCESYDIVPIAALFAGDFLALQYSPRKRKDPAVVVWSHEESMEYSPVTYPVSPNFDEFMRTGLID